ncbi:MAG: hypothetical protein H6765_01020 [Candidatus Peribacteria bacterium]|nr:MAG: hypothetical protein H6765_01020 [Candidatus Peribacteria bacterium]
MQRKQVTPALLIGIILGSAVTILVYSTSTQSGQTPVFQAQSVNTFDCSQVTDIPQTECEALVDIYDTTD